jgi:hypothetical protein
MEFVEGTDVAKMLSQQKRLHTEHAMAITAHVCDALAYAHERGIIHRDIKPANIMVGYDGVVKVADFGLAKMTHNQNSGLTQSGMAMGTLHYMAPEALMLGSAVDHRADIYAVGVMLYQMLTGKIPQGLFELPSLQVPGLDPRYDGIIGKALREDRELRYPTVLAMRHDLDAILTQPVVKVEPSAEKAPAALQTQARPQRPAGQPYRPPQPEVIVRTEKKSSPLMWVALIAMAALAAWLGLKKSGGEPTPEPIGAAGTPTAASGPSAAPPPHEALGGPSAQPSISSPASATKEAAFVNSLGMKFVPVPNTKVLFCIHETRRQDYAAYAAAVTGVDGTWKDPTTEGFTPTSRTEEHPVIKVNWTDAQKFCAWLSEKEGKKYRLPTDQEWSHAVGIGSGEKWMQDTTPATVIKNNMDFPWGSQWPPPQGAGNYSDQSRKEKAPNSVAQYLEPYDDGFPTTAPVMSFKPNNLGLYDLGGNVLEWCEDWFEITKEDRVLRGGAWNVDRRIYLLSSHRSHFMPTGRYNHYGFRCVIEVASQPTLPTKAPVVPSSAPQPTQAATTTVSTSSSTVGDPPDTTKQVVDLLALVDLKKDALRGEWTSVEDGILGGTGIESGRTGLQCLQFPHAVTSAEYDFEIVLSQKEGPTRSGFSMQFPAAGTTITLGTQVYAKMDKPWYGFLNLDGKGALGPSKDFYIWREPYVAGVKYRSTVKVRKNSLTGMMDGKVLVHWEGDLTRFKSSGEKVSDSRFLAAVASTGYGTIIHKATLTKFVPQAPQPPAPTLPTSPTTWTDTKGRSITATFKAVASGNVLLDIAGKVTSVPLNTLSAESQKLAWDYHDQSNPATTNDLTQATQ